MEDNNDWCTFEEPTGLPAAWKYLKNGQIFSRFSILLCNAYQLLRRQEEKHKKCAD